MGDREGRRKTETGTTGKNHHADMPATKPARAEGFRRDAPDWRGLGGPLESAWAGRDMVYVRAPKLPKSK
jgi:hypothetical protein